MLVIHRINNNNNLQKNNPNHPYKKHNKLRLEKLNKSKSPGKHTPQLRPNLMVIRKVKFFETINDDMSAKKFKVGGEFLNLEKCNNYNLNNNNNNQVLKPKFTIRNLSKSLEKVNEIRNLHKKLELNDKNDKFGNVYYNGYSNNLFNISNNVFSGINIIKPKLPPLNTSNISNLDFLNKAPSVRNKSKNFNKAGGINLNINTNNFNSIDKENLNSNENINIGGNINENDEINLLNGFISTRDKKHEIINNDLIIDVKNCINVNKSKSPTIHYQSPIKIRQNNKDNITLNNSNRNIKNSNQRSFSPEKRNLYYGTINKNSIKDANLNANSNLNSNVNVNLNIAQKINYFIVKRGNNRELIKSIILMRSNWKEAQGDFTTVFNYKWANSKKGTEYTLMRSEKNKRLVNHFEFDYEISNKKFMFLNFGEYCDKNNLNLFDYVPLTIIIKINGNFYKENYAGFKTVYKKIQKLTQLDSTKLWNNNPILNTDGNNNNINNIGNNKTPKNLTKNNENKLLFSELFKSESLNYKTSNSQIYIPTTHYTGKNLWLVKPTDLYGGKCIQISDQPDEIEKIIKKFHDGIEKKMNDDNPESDSESSEEMGSNSNSNQEISKGKYRASTVLIQKYIENPLLYYGRKFDIRMWVLIDQKLDVYFFKEGHLKTTSTEYSTETKDKFVHITNYSLQKYNNNFEKFEIGNEVSFKEFQNCLDKENINVDIRKVMIPQMVEIIKHTTLAVKDKLNKKNRKYCYVNLGYDFMIDINYKVWLIEINKNPGLVESSPIIKRLVPRMIDDSLKITLDPIFDNKFVNLEMNKNSPFPVDDYSDGENMFEFIHNLNNNNVNIG